MAAKDADVRRASATYAGHARVAGLSTEQRQAMAAEARAGLERKWQAEALAADPTLIDNPAELAHQVAALRRLHMAKLTLSSVQARARAKAERETAELESLLGGGDL